MTAAALLQFVPLIIQAVQAIPALVSSIEHVVQLVKNHGELTDAQKADLLAQLASTAVAVAAYQPRPKA
jgi:hypothetical protein